MPEIKCPYCRSNVALDRLGVHFQKFCTAIPAGPSREAAIRKYNLFYTQLQAHTRGEITIEELQKEANRLFHSGK